MQASYFILDFSLWYYTRAFRDILGVWLNFMWFIVHFFSIPLLLRTLFSPWRRMTDAYERKGLESLMTTFVMNIMTRIFGAIVRTTIIVCGLVVLIFGAILLFVTIALWITMPFLVLYSFFYGISILLS